MSIWDEYISDDDPQAKQKRRAASREWCGAPRRVWDVLAGEVAETEAIARVREWLKARKTDQSVWCLVLSAGKGAGKSVAAGLAMEELGAHPVDRRNRLCQGEDIVSWWPSSRLARLSGYDGRFDKICESPHIVVIDDLGTEFLDAKGWFLQAVDALVDARYAGYLPTIITTNLTGQAFKERYSERVVDRLREGGSFFEFAGKSLRCKQ
jgi:hypothetical protein